MGVLIVLGSVFAVVAVLLLVLGVRQIRAIGWVERNGISVPGVVVGIHVVSGEDASTYYPVVRFWTADRKEIETRSMKSCKRRGAIPGQPVTVRYDPRNPLKAIAYGVQSPLLNGSPAVLVIVGAMFLPLGLLFLAIGLVTTG